MGLRVDRTSTVTPILRSATIYLQKKMCVCVGNSGISIPMRINRSFEGSRGGIQLAENFDAEQATHLPGLDDATRPEVGRRRGEQREQRACQ